MSSLDDGLIHMKTLHRSDGSAETHDEDAGSQQQPSFIQGELDQAMAALQLPEIAQVLSALAALQRPEVVASLGVLQRLAAKNQSIASLPSRKRSPSMLNATLSQTLKPIFRNNLFIITFAWTFLGIFLLYVADRNSVSDSAAITIFSIYMIMQVTLVVLILYVTQRQVKKVTKSNRITLGFLIQGWLALVYSFAGIYAFMNHAYQLGLLNHDPNVRHAPCSVRRARLTTPVQMRVPDAKALGFSSVCVFIPNREQPQQCHSFFASNFFTTTESEMRDIFHDFIVFM